MEINYTNPPGIIFNTQDCSDSNWDPVVCTNSQQAVTWTVNATDNVDASSDLQIECNHTSDSTFRAGQYPVYCFATDAAGNIGYQKQWFVFRWQLGATRCINKKIAVSFWFVNNLLVLCSQISVYSFVIAS